MTKKSKERPSIMLGVPVERNIGQHAFFHFLAIAARGWPFAYLPYTRNDIARNKFAAAALRGGFDWLCMLDSDHKHPADIVERLYRCVEKDPSIRVIGGLNFRRGKPYDPCAFIIDDEGNTYGIMDWEPGILEVQALGTGSILIHTSVFEDVPFPWFAYAYDETHHVDDGWPGVDMYFCRKLREAGIKMYVDTTTSSPHLIDDQTVTEQTYRSYLQANEDRIAASVGYEQVMGKQDGQGEPPLGDVVVREIGDILGGGGRVLELGDDELPDAYTVTRVTHEGDGGIVAPIAPNGGRAWYDAETLKERLPLAGEYDLLLVDGPPGHVGRLGMLEHLDLFDLTVPIVVDDVQRNAERYLLRKIADAAGRPFRIVQDEQKAFGIIE